jgi:hypothetical protein
MPAPDLIRGGYRVPACAKPRARFVIWLDASAGEAKSGKRSCSKNKLERDDDSKKSHHALMVAIGVLRTPQLSPQGAGGPCAPGRRPDFLTAGVRPFSRVQALSCGAQVSSPHAAPAYAPVCGPGGLLRFFLAPFSPRAFRRISAASSHGKRLPAASSSSAPGEPDRRCCRGQIPAKHASFCLFETPDLPME